MILTSKKIRGLLAAMLLAFPGGEALFGLSPEDLIDPAYSSALSAGEKPVLVQFKDPQPLLIPRNGLLRGLVDAVHRDLNPSVMVESLYRYTKPPLAEKTVWNSREAGELYNHLLALSTLSGIEYYSATRGTMRILYESSTLIDGPSTKKPLPDPSYLWPLAELTVYARQKDLSFGDNIYQFDFYTAPDIIMFIQENLSSLSYGILPAVGKNKLRSTVAVLDAGEYLLVYIASMSRAASVPGMKDRIGNSFTNRADAIFHWFSDQADRAFMKAHS